MEVYGRDWCIRSYTMMAGVLANFGLNSWDILPIWHMFPTRCGMGGFFHTAIAWDGIEDDNQPLDQEDRFWVIAILTEPSSQFYSLTKLASS